MAPGSGAEADPGESGPRTSKGRGERLLLLAPTGGEGQGAEMTAALPEGKTRVSAAKLVNAFELTEEAPVAIEEPRGEGLKTGELSGDDVAVGGKCCVIASCKRHLTSSAVDRSSGVCPS